MAAEAYRAEQDPGLAARRLAIFGSQSPSAIAASGLDLRARKWIRRFRYRPHPGTCHSHAGLEWDPMRRIPWDILLALLAGLGLGLVYSWVISPCTRDRCRTAVRYAPISKIIIVCHRSGLRRNGNLPRAQARSHFCRRF